MTEHRPHASENTMAHFTDRQLIRRMETAKDFAYDDEAVELSRRLGERALNWRWSEDFYNPRVVVYEAEQVNQPTGDQE